MNSQQEGLKLSNDKAIIDLEILNESPLSWQGFDGDNKVNLPKSEVAILDDAWTMGDCVEVEIPVWLALKLKLI